MNERDKQFIDSAKKILDESLNDLDGATLSRLAQNRRQALADRRVSRRPHFRPLAVAGWGGGLATAGLLVFLVIAGPFGRDPSENGLVADLSLFTAEESIDFFQDIEFYEWLSAMETEEMPSSGVARPLPDALHAGGGLVPDPGTAGRGTAGRGVAGVSRLIRG